MTDIEFGLFGYWNSNGRLVGALCFMLIFYKLSNSSSQRALEASEGIGHELLGERLTEPTHGPSGLQERLNCCPKKRRMKVRRQALMAAAS